jgi:phosphatidylserine/phosphatidylglycerophosphate/cardiolipin synthase-like enzyme
MATVINTAVTVSTYVGATLLSYRHRDSYPPRVKMPREISERVYKFCTSEDSVSSEIAKDFRTAPKDAAKKLYGHVKISVSAEKPPKVREPATEEQLQRAFECGKWGPTKPSELFLRIYHDALCTLDHDPLLGCVSPSLMGSCGTIPLTVIGPLPDLVRHMSNLIARAEKEVFLATNYWIFSDSSTLITDAMRELSKRAGQRKEKIIMKMMYDRGTPKQAIHNHQLVSPSEYSTGKVCLPAPEDIPNIDLQVINYHRPTFGTFHAKFMVVDRKIGVVSSNNIQDNDNFEMLTQIEGPIVDSLYDVCLISWHEVLNPPLPSYNTPASSGGYPTFSDPTFHSLFDANGKLIVPSAGPARDLKEVVQDGEQTNVAIHIPGEPHYDNTISGEITRVQRILSPRDGKTRMELVTDHLNIATHQNRKGGAPPCRPEEEMTPYIPHPVSEAFPIALVNRKPYGAPNHACVNTPQNEAWLSAVRNAKRTIFVQTPDLNAEPLLPEIVAAVKRGIEVTYYVCLGYNDAGELLPKQGGHNEMVAYKLKMELEPEERGRLRVGYYVAKDQMKPIHNKFKSRSCHSKC